MLLSKIKSSYIILLIFAIIVALFLFFLFFPKLVTASFMRPPEVKIFSADNNQLEESFMAFSSYFRGGVSVAVADFGSDGTSEIVVGAGSGGGPQVMVLRADGSIISSFFAYDQRIRNGIKVAAGDLDGDGKAEIVTGTNFGAGPQVRVFDLYGKPLWTAGFFAYDSAFRGGINIAIGDVDGDGQGEIITGPGLNSGPQVRVFDRFGHFKGIDFWPFDQDHRGGVSVATANVDGGPATEIVTAVYRYGQAWVKVYKYGIERRVVGEFLAFPEDFVGGINIAAGDLDHDGLDEIAVIPAGAGSAHLRAFEAYGEPIANNLIAYEEDFHGGANLAIGEIDDDGIKEIIVGPARAVAEGRTDLYKYIEIDISEQKLRYYEGGVKLGDHPVSTGKYSMPTPLGQFSVLSKQRVAWSAKYGLYMPYWMQFTPAGHGIHELPEWPGGYKEGANHLGVRVSHGCVRLGIGPAANIWNWADIGTPVIIHE